MEGRLGDAVTLARRGAPGQLAIVVVIVVALGVRGFLDWVTW